MTRSLSPIEEMQGLWPTFDQFKRDFIILFSHGMALIEDRERDPSPCLHCHLSLGLDECANDRGEPSGVHADCWAAWQASEASIAEDRAVDRAMEREMFREWGGR